MTDAQGWTLLALVGVLLSVIGSLVVQQVNQFGDRIDTRIDGLESTIAARLDRSAAVRRRGSALRAVDRRFEHLDRDVQALIRDRFGRE